jgi:hypothetical protein
MSINLLTNELIKGCNKITILSKVVIYDDMSIILKCGNHKSIPNYEVSGNVVDIDVYVDEDNTYELIIKNGNEVHNLELLYNNKDVVATHHNFIPTIEYNNGIINMTIKSDMLNISDTELVLTGDINKNVIWKAGEESISLSFLINISFNKIIKYKINNQPFANQVFDKSLFPNSFIRTNNGIKLNKICPYALNLHVDNTVIPILPNQTDIAYVWVESKLFKLEFEGDILFSQNIIGSISKPEMILVDNPIRIKIAYPILENIKVKIIGFDKPFIIESGKYELELPTQQFSSKTHEVIYEITEATGVILKQTKWRFLYR